jgi:hypothetical protein
VDHEERTENRDRRPEIRASRTAREEHSAKQEDGKLQNGRNHRRRDEL